MASPPQNFANHRRFVPLFHFGVLGILVLNLLWALYRLFRSPTLDAGMSALLAVAILGLAFYVRMFPLAVQDRVIRLEMRLRLRDVLPADLQPRIGELTRGQLVALRFASDSEMPDLVRAVLTEGIRDRSAIKKRIKHWQADRLRC